MVNPRILIFSSRLDVHVPYVTKYLNKDEFLVIDPLSEIIDGGGIDFVFSKNKLKVSYQNYDLSGIKSIWYRKTSVVDRNLLPIEEDKKSYAMSALNTHVSSLAYLFPDAFWMSERPAVWRANSKPLQLTYAARLGLNVPETLFASTTEAAEKFIKEHGTCIAKNQAREFPPNKIVFTKIIQEKDDLDFSGLQFDPYIFQQYVEPAYELRVTVVGSQVFPATVAGEETDGVSSSYRDWRYAHVNDTFKAAKADLSEKISRQCVELVHDLGLTYGAIDLIVDKKGKTWFLEINPNGQWAFIEELTGQPIGKTIARLLRAGK